MAERPLSPDEALLWQRVMQGIRPIARVASPKRKPPKPLPFRGGVGVGPVRTTSSEPTSSWDRVLDEVRPLPGRIAPPKPAPQSPLRDERPAVQAAPHPKPSPQGEVPKKVPGNTLDGSWDRQLARGAVSPDSTIDLHGHTLQSAYVVLDHGLARAIQRGDRVLLLVTGKPPRPESERPHARGAIRAAVADWLARSRHADRIAAVRGAHPRHGGAGALYIILRRIVPGSK